ncbi:glycosyltransferase [Salisediminibacterium beveridgei]|uniref:Glycosyl transferase, group 1 family protein n=1 Tax=Salisediminibacterium beveridgei TaxID=632773 RepID=A0A1D7QRS2_9BACI|nr:glycosyltransferase [Salisediminibacterium beveridgei]AOM81690.1 Glycosyl transferase, group 1 family protein [Salisediminibacterium beveridgei]
MKKVTMFVWNHFTNDARVMREGTALSALGYQTELIAIDDPTDDTVHPYETIDDGFSVTRVQRYPGLLQLMSRRRRRAAAVLLVWLLVALVAGVSYHPVLGIALALPALLLAVAVKQVLFRVIWIRLAIIMRMIRRGWQTDADVYHSHDLNTLIQGTVCAKCRFKKRKLIYDSHEVQTSRTGYNTPWFGRYERFLLRFTDEVIVENHTRAKRHEELYGYYPKTLYNYSSAIDISDYDDVDLYERLSIPKAHTILLYQGGVQEGRGLELLVKAMKNVDGATLVMMGEGKIKESLMEMTTELGLNDRIKFHPKVPLMSLPSYTKQGYVGFQVLQNICFNHYSASSNKLFEYIMAHVPVIACNFPEIKKVVEEEEVGLVVDSHSLEEITAAIRFVLDHPEKRDEWSQNCRTAKLKYNWDVEKDKLKQVYDAILGVSHHVV